MYIYLIHVYEFLNANKKIYKIGRTNQENIKRFYQYPKGSLLLLHTKVNDCYKAERELIIIFKEKFKWRKEYGNEYFEGSLEKMKDIINDYAHSMNRNISTSVYKLDKSNDITNQVTNNKSKKSKQNNVDIDNIMDNCSDDEQHKRKIENNDTNNEENIYDISDEEYNKDDDIIEEDNNELEGKNNELIEKQENITYKYKSSALDNNKINRLKLYLDILNINRFDNYDDLISIGAIIFNECENFKLFIHYSKKSKKYDYKVCRKLWNTYANARSIKATIIRLITMAEEDNQFTPAIFIKALQQDRESILNTLFNMGYSDLFAAYLFVCDNQNKFISDSITSNWYYLNNYGIYCIDDNNSYLSNSIDHYFNVVLKIEFNKRIVDISSSKKRKIFMKTYRDMFKKICSTKNNTNIIIKLQKILTVSGFYNKLDSSNPNLVGFTNGVYDLKNRIFRIAKPEELISVTTGYDYKEADKNLKVKAMELLQTVFPNELELKYVLKTLSLGLYGLNPTEQFFIWIGSGSNGKGLYRDIMMRVLGDYFDSMEISYLYKSNVTRSTAADPVMAKKKNSRIVISTEPETDCCLKCSTIKAITGNDVVQVRQLYGESFNFTPKFSLIIQTNTMPNFHGFDNGMARRAVMINFPIKFVDNPKNNYEKKIDRTLKEKINVQFLYRAEFFEILADHYALYETEGLDIPPRILKDTTDFLNENNPIEEWLRTSVEITRKSNDMVKSSELYNNFYKFTDENVKGLTPDVFKEKLSNKGIIFKRRSDGNYYVGIKLYETDNDDNIG